MTDSKTCPPTTQALFLNSLLNEPLLVLVGLTAALLVKEFNATAWQISIYTTLRPLMALFSFYLSSFIIGRHDRLIPQLLITGLLCRLPFFLFPWISSAWQVIACAAFYLMLSSSGMPAWIEVLKINLADRDRSRLFSMSSVCAYIVGIILAIVFGNLLKHEHGSWRWLFPLCAMCGVLSLFWQARIPLRTKAVAVVGAASPRSGFAAPWLAAVRLLTDRIDFRRFQVGFAGCGAAVMLVYAVMPHYLIEHLQVSYKDIAISIAFFKALGYTLTSSLWVKKMQQLSIYKASSLIFLCVSCFPLLLIASYTYKLALYAAFGIYGVGLAGNHLIWHMSAPFFSRGEDSSPYSAVNVLMVGVRGLVAPMAGAVLGQLLGLQPVLWIATVLCLIAATYMAWLETNRPVSEPFIKT